MMLTIYKTGEDIFIDEIRPSFSGAIYSAPGGECSM